MRILFRDSIFEVTEVRTTDNSRYVRVDAGKSRQFVIDCETPSLAQYLKLVLLTQGYFDASGVDYTESLGDVDWYNYCDSKTEKQMKLGKWVDENIVLPRHANCEVRLYSEDIKS